MGEAVNETLNKQKKGNNGQVEVKEIEHKESVGLGTSGSCQ
jgi:hypothetical protein